MKKELLFLAALCLASVQVQGQTTVDSGTCGTEADGSNLTWTLTSDGTLTISGTGDMADFTFGNQPWQDHLTAIRTAVVQEGVTSVGDYFLYKCTGLTSLTLPAGLMSVGDYFLWNCTGLTSIDLPDGLTSAEHYFLSGCTGLTSLTLPEELSSVGDYFLSNFTGLTSIDLPDGLTSVGSYFLQNCTGLTSIDLPAGLTSAEHYFLSGCTGLTSLTLPEGLSSVGNYFLYKCTGLTSLTLPEELSSVGDYFLSNFTGLTSIDLPDGLTSVGSYFLQNCTGLTSIDLPDGLTSVGNHFLSNCTGLTSLTLPAGLTSAGGQFLLGCTGLTSLTLPAGLKEAGYYFLYKCTGMQELTVPAATPPAIGEVASFIGMATDSIPVYVPAASIGTYASTVPWNLFRNYKAFIPSGTCGAEAGGSNLTWILTEDSTLTISGTGDMADFTSGNQPWQDHLTAIRTAVVQEGVTSVGNYFLLNCTGLTSIDLPDGLTSVGSYFLNNCTGLTSIDLPDGLTSVGNYFLLNCKGLQELTVLAATPPVLGSEGAFAGVDNTIPVYVPAGSTEAYAMADGWNYFTDYRDVGSAGIGTPSLAACVTVAGGEVRLHLADNPGTHVYDLQGRLVLSTTACRFALPPGIYIIKVGDDKMKVAL